MLNLLSFVKNCTICVIFIIAIINQKLYSQEGKNNISINLENIDNVPTLILKDSKFHRQKLNVNINSTDFSLVFIDQKAHLPKEFADKSFIALRKSVDSFFQTSLYLIIKLGYTFIVKVSIINIIIVIGIIIAISLIVRVLLSIIAKILLPAIIIVTLFVILLKPSFIQKDIYNNIIEYKNKIIDSIKGLF